MENPHKCKSKKIWTTWVEWRGRTPKENPSEIIVTIIHGNWMHGDERWVPKSPTNQWFKSGTHQCHARSTIADGGSPAASTPVLSLALASQAQSAVCLALMYHLSCHFSYFFNPLILLFRGRCRYSLRPQTKACVCVCIKEGRRGLFASTAFM